MNTKILLIGCVLITGCGSAPYPPINPIVTPTPKSTQLPLPPDAKPYFAAYSSNSVIRHGDNQPFSIMGQFIKIDANFLYFGDPSSYDSETSSFKPNQPGLYFIDEELEIEGTFTESTILLTTQINYNDALYLAYDQTITVPVGSSVIESGYVHSLICFNGTTDHAEAYMKVSCGSGLTNCGGNMHVFSNNSQYEGYYVGPCNGHND